MKANIIERLRSVNSCAYPYANELVTGWCHEAAREIERLRAAIGDRLHCESCGSWASLDDLECDCTRLDMADRQKLVPARVVELERKIFEMEEALSAGIFRRTDGGGR